MEPVRSIKALLPIMCIVVLAWLGGCSPRKLDYSRSESEPPVELTFFDVGEGDAALLRQAGRWAALIDCGNPSGAVRLSTAIGALNQPLDYLFLTHPHLDHIGAVFTLLGLVPVKRIFDNGQPLGQMAKQNDFLRWYGEKVRRRADYRAVSSPKRFKLAETTKLEVLWPPRALPSKDWNTNSLVLLLTHGKFRSLFMGDGNLATEAALLKRYPHLAGIDVLQAGHHGAADTASQSFVDLLKPKLVVISVNANNIRGYPDASAIERYKSSGAKVLRTDLHSTVAVRAWADGTFHQVE